MLGSKNLEEISRGEDRVEHQLMKGEILVGISLWTKPFESALELISYFIWGVYRLYIMPRVLLKMHTQAPNTKMSAACE